MANYSIQRQQELISNLRQLIADRAATEAALHGAHQTQTENAETIFGDQSSELEAEFRTARAALESEYLTKLSEARRWRDAHFSKLNYQEQEAVDDLRLKQGQAHGAAKRSWQLERDAVVARHKQDAAQVEAQWSAYVVKMDENRSQLVSVQEHFQAIAKKRNVDLPEVTPSGEVEQAENQLNAFFEELRHCRRELKRLAFQPAARFLEDGWPVMTFIFTALALIFPAGHYLGWTNLIWPIAAGGTAAVFTFGLVIIARPLVKRFAGTQAPLLHQRLVDTERHLTLALSEGKGEAHAKRDAVNNARDGSLIEADVNWSNKKEELDGEFGAKLDHQHAEATQQRDEIQGKFDAEIERLNKIYRPQISEREREFKERSEELQSRHDELIEAARKSFDEGWGRLVQQWTEGVETFQLAVAEMNNYCGEFFPTWEEADWTKWTPSETELAALRFGSYWLRMGDIEDGVPEHDDFRVQKTDYHIPAVLGFPECPSLLFRTHDEGRDEAVVSIQDIMLRMLTSFPPGKVRFTIIDPTGLGQNFSAFMHLADYDDRFVTNRIWTETSHINQRLLDLTEHMENVIQKYLRNEFESIQQYNREAGEVAEPFQILVVANFPTNFSEEAARRLVSIASSGARCGVYTLISVDTKMKLPRNFDLQDLESTAAALDWNDDRGAFEWTHDALRPLDLTLETPPNEQIVSDAIRSAGELAKKSSRVEVPFANVAPPTNDLWTHDSREEIYVPLGRSGATKLQALHLGHGTSQHVLISGKTGSGKSTLLHALITNAALYYSPDEIQLYLIDFKKGVEFKPYASHNLPHARVIAIESEREFGMSVLERLDQELKERGDLFRAHGVQGVKGYRDANPEAVLPRILLIIDEFQEFFVKDDKIAQDASLLLDRLVRQGRAFGIHVLLGSQTLAGAYSLARSTIGQMAVRIALQCSEGDAHLILSEDNTAARLLNRPGEAIYNDANGLFEGNNPFQTVWLPDEERELYLSRINELNERREIATRPAIVFEGNVPADPSHNTQLRQQLSTAVDEVNLAPTAWLGSAVAIKDATAVVFRRQNGANLLLVGQQGEMALGVLTSAAVSLESHLPPESDAAAGGNQRRYYVLDGARADSPEAGAWNRLNEQLPMSLGIHRSRNSDDALVEISTELTRRMTEGEDNAPPIFCFIYDLSRFRTLKRSEDFSFSFDEEDKPDAAKLLIQILREGPPLGIHCLIWCDSYNNAARWLDRQSMNDIEMRVLFQMSASDSSNLMDSPAAGKLGVNRAMLYSEDEGVAEKFRPYGPASDEWISWVREMLGERQEKGMTNV